MGNLVTEETSYIDSNASETDNMLVLPKSKFAGSNQLLLAKSCVPKRYSFKLVKLFALNMDLAAVPGKTNGASTPSKFPGIIKSSFMSELSLKKAKELAIREKIVMNNDVRQVNKCTNWEVIVKEIPVNLPKLAVESVFSKFGKIISKALVEFKSANVASLVVFKWSVFMGKDLVHMVLVDKASKLAAIGSVPCKQFGYISNACSSGGISEIHEKWVITDQDWVCLAGIYKKKQALIAHPVSFGGKTWAQVAGGLSSHVAFLVSFGAAPFFAAENSLFTSALPGTHDLYGHLAFLECFLELLANQVSGILVKLGSLELVLLAAASGVSFSKVLVTVAPGLDSNMILDGESMVSTLSPLVVNDTTTAISSSNSKVLTTKVGGLESKIVALEVSVKSVLEKLDCLCSGLVWKIAMCNVRGINNLELNNLISIVTETKLKGKIHPWIMNKFDGFWVFTSGLNSGHMGFGIVIVMDISLAKHVCKVSEVPGQLLSIKLLFKNKLSVFILGFYAGASLVVWFSQTGKVNSLIAKAVNESSFVVLGGNFNKNSLHKSASFKRCLDLELINSLSGSPVVKRPTWKNLRSVKKTINFMLVSFNLVNAVVDCNVVDAVSVSVGLSDLLDTQLNSFHRQANRDYWKFDFRGANDTNAGMFANEFTTAVHFSDLDVMWNVLYKIMTLSTHEIFRKKWFKNFDGVFTRDSSRFHKLELLVSKLVKASCLVFSVKFASLLDTWCGIDANSASVIKSLFLLDSNFDMIHSALVKVRKFYCSSKLLEFRHAEEACIKVAINKRMESFGSDKSYTIRSVLECLFHKVVLDYLVVSNKLVLKPSLVKLRMDGIMEGWTRKCRVMSNISDKWSCQYWLLEYVFNDVFSGMMCSVSIDELLGVVSNFPESKAAAWVLMISKPYEWDGVLMNTRPIALIKTAYKILSKILSDRISSTYNTFDVLHGDNFLVLRGTMTQLPIFAIG
ncbi:hypothetical protein G9A89_012848 [Geosiphon pyriformis]|nr:hypothetical protein G9A89_012848 [Geosiphon pyriformis]